MTNHLDDQVTVFLDTMVWIHCVPIQDIDLCLLLGAENVKVFIPRITIQELDKHKNSHSSQRIRRRVAQRLKDIGSWGEAQASEVRGGVTVSVVTRRPSQTFFNEGLDSNWADDQLIAAILDHKESNPLDRVVLVSHDVGPKLTALHFGIEVLEIPEKWRISPEEDPLVRENKRLRNELLSIQKSQPSLVLRLSEMEDADEHMCYEIRQSEPVESPDKDAIIAALKDNYPVMNRSPLSLDAPQGSIAILGESLFSMPKPAEYSRYNHERLEFFSRYEEYLDWLAKYHTQDDRTVWLHFEVRNIGNAPADDIDVYIYFPDGFGVYTEDDLPGEPDAPSPPVKPRSDQEMMLASLSLARPVLPDLQALTKVRETFSLRRTKSYELREHYDRIKHGYRMPIRPIAVIFDSFDEANSFSITYDLNVGNLPNPEVGEINVVVQK